nr:molybdopterin-dependent oxidoreductase [uncultured Devosia sp.]
MYFPEGMSRPRAPQKIARNAFASCALAAACLFAASGIQAAEPLPAPQGDVILLVSGNLGVTNTPEGAAFDRDMLADLGLATLETSTPWTDGVQTFEGVLARTVIERVEAKGETVMATALNDYMVEVPISDFLDYDVLLATTMNGQQMQVSDKGPVWIVYPRDQVPELQNRKLHDRWVWQLKSLQFK